MNTQTITTEKAIEMFLNYGKENSLSYSGVNFGNLTYMVDEAKSKTVNGKKLIQKLVNLTATIGSDYQAKVGRILDKEGKEIDFVSQPMRGKEYVESGKPVATDTKTKAKFYLVFIAENHSKPQVQYYKNGVAVEKAEIWNEENITPAGLNPKVQVAGRGMIEEENNFHFRTLDFSNLRSFVMNKTLFTIEN
jgi:hypothetical protein